MIGSVQTGPAETVLFVCYFFFCPPPVQPPQNFRDTLHTMSRHTKDSTKEMGTNIVFLQHIAGNKVPKDTI